MFNKTVSLALLLAVLLPLSQQRTVRNSRSYSGCGPKYQCFGIPDNCLARNECQVLLKVRPFSTGFTEFELFWFRPANSTDSWVASALSSDRLMGDDSATVFLINEDNTVSDFDGITYHNPEKREAGVTPFFVDGVFVNRSRFADGVLTVQWTRAQKTSVNKLPFDIKKDKYYVMLAYGPLKAPDAWGSGQEGKNDSKLLSIKLIFDLGKLSRHTSRWVSENAYNLFAESKIKSNPIRP